MKEEEEEEEEEEDEEEEEEEEEAVLQKQRQQWSVRIRKERGGDRQRHRVRQSNTERGT